MNKRRNVVTVDDLPELSRAYNKAVADKRDRFTYNGNEILTSYAKYLIEYLKTIPKRG
jgi:hypothetical protein